jgi:hypothetical protein
MPYSKEHGLGTDCKDAEGTLKTDEEEENMSISDDDDDKGVKEENGNGDVEMKD